MLRFIKENSEAVAKPAGTSRPAGQQRVAPQSRTDSHARAPEKGAWEIDVER